MFFIVTFIPQGGYHKVWCLWCGLVKTNVFFVLLNLLYIFDVTIFC